MQEPGPHPLLDAHDALAAHKELDGRGIQMAVELDILALEWGADPSWERERLAEHLSAGGSCAVGGDAGGEVRARRSRGWLPATPPYNP